MKSDPILEEVWKAKDGLARRFNYDRMAEYFRSKEEDTPPQCKASPVQKPHRCKSLTQR